MTTTTDTTGTKQVNAAASSFAAHSNVSCLSREEESLIKMALTMVVLKKRRRRLRLPDDGTNKGESRDCQATNEDDTVEQPISKKSMLDGLFGPSFTNTSTSQCSSLLLQKPHRSHIDEMFRVACSMAAASQKQRQGINDKPLCGTTNHLMQQLQTWITSTDKDGVETAVETWIRSSLLSQPPHSFVVFQVLIPQVTYSPLISAILRVVVGFIHDLYHDHSVKNLTCSCDVLAVSLLRLLPIVCKSHGEQRNQDIMSILREFLGDLLVPLPLSSLPKAHWQLAKSASRRQRGGTTSGGDGISYLDPGAKLLLRMTLYRVVQQQIILLD